MLTLEKIIRYADREPEMQETAYLLYDREGTPLKPIRVVGEWELEKLFELFRELKEM